MSFGGRAPPGPAGGAYNAPPDPLAALKLFAPSALDPRRLRRLASCPRRLETKRFGSSFFPFKHCAALKVKVLDTAYMS